MATQTQVYSIVFNSEAATRNAQDLGAAGIDSAAKLDALSASIEGLVGDLKRLGNVRTPKISLPKIPDLPKTQKTGLMHSLRDIGEGFERLNSALNDIPGMEAIGRGFQIVGAFAEAAAMPVGAFTIALATIPVAAGVGVAAILGVVSATAEMGKELKEAGRADLISERQFAQLDAGERAIQDLINEGKQLAVTFGAELAPVGTSIAKYLGESLRDVSLNLADLLDQFSTFQRMAAVMTDMGGGFVMEAVTGDSMGVRLRQMAAETKAVSDRIRSERAAQAMTPAEIEVIGTRSGGASSASAGRVARVADPFESLASAFESGLKGLDTALTSLAERQAAEAGRIRAAEQAAAAAFSRDLRDTQDALGALAEDVRDAGPEFKAAAREAALGQAGNIASALSSGSLEGLLSGVIPVVGEPLAAIVSLLRNFDKVIPALIRDIISALPDIVIGVVKGIAKIPGAIIQGFANQFSRLFDFLAPNNRRGDRFLPGRVSFADIFDGRAGSGGSLGQLYGGIRPGSDEGVRFGEIFDSAQSRRNRLLRNNAEAMRGAQVNVTNIGEIKPDLARKLAAAIRTSSGGYGGVGV